MISLDRRISLAMFGASPFGAAAPAQFGAPGGFGAPQPSPSFGGGGAFGAPATTPNSFAAKPPASPFVAAPAPGFGAAASTTSFGFGQKVGACDARLAPCGPRGATHNLICAPPPRAQQPAGGAFASPTPFSAPAPAGLGFGGAPGTSPFGAAQPAAATFGASGFGASQPASAFGTTTTTFGAGGGFGGAAKPAFPSPAPAPAAPFGAAAAPGAPFSFGGAGGVGGGMFKSPTAATSPFGAAAPQSAPFGAPAPGAPGASPFGGAASFGGAATPGFGGGGAFGMQAPTAGTGAPPFQVTREADAAAQASGKASQMNYFSITNMPQYAHKSFEELRFEDYSKGNKGSSNGAPGMSGFGAQAAAPAPAFGLPTPAFGATAAAASPFGAAPTPAFGAAAPTPAPAFGATSTGFGQPGALAPAPFGAPAPAAGASNYSFSSGFGGAQPAASAPFGAPASTSLFSATSAKLATPAFGAPAAANNLGFGATAPFGAAAPAAPKPGGLFGAAPAPTASPFGATGFGVAAPAPAAAAPGASLFGANPMGGANAFGAAAPPAAAPAAFSFGSAPSTAAPSLSTFAPAPAPQSSFGGFGNLAAPAAPAPAPGVFGSFSGSTFGKPAATAPAFGVAATAGTGLFGAPSFASPAAAPGFGGVTGASGLLGAPSAVAPLVASHNQDAFGAHDSQVGMGAVASGVSSLEQRGLEIRLDGESLPNAVAKGLSEAEAAAAAASDGGGSSLGTTMQTFRHTPRTAARIRPRGYARSSASGADQDQQLALRGDPASSSHDAQLLSPESYLSHSHRRLVIDPNPRSRHGTDKHTGTAAVTTHDSRQTPAKPSRLFDGRSPFTPGSAHRSDARTPEHTPSLHAGASAAGSSSMHKPTPKKTPGQFTPGFSRAQDDDIDEWQPPPPVDKHNENEPGDAVRTYDSYREYDKDRRALGDVDDNAGTTLAAMSASAPNPNAPILSRAQYVCHPPIVELQRLDDRQLGAVDDFEIRRVGYGKIKWEGAIDLLGVNLDTDVLICENENGKPEVAVYHDRDERKPARGEKLNRPAVITLEKVHAGSSRCARGTGVFV